MTAHAAPDAPPARRLVEAGRLVVKIGSSLLVDEPSGRLNRRWLDGFARDMARLRARGQDVVIVSSGAIALGRRHLGLKKRLKLEDGQAAAAVGQIQLAHAYQDALARHEISVAQILLTIGDAENRRRYLNARETFETLLKFGTVPVVNENDTVATNEIRFGDNDRLAALVTQMVSADCLVLLSDVDGLMTADPAKDPAAVLVPEVSQVTAEIEGMAGATRTLVGTGGMVTKVAAAKSALAAGAHVVIARGSRIEPLAAIEEGAPVTWFLPRETPLAARKQWIAASLPAAGALTVDRGAADALRDGKSLLPAGVRGIDGSFERGDAVIVRGPRGEALGRGLVAYSDRDARLIAGHKSREIEEILGYRGRTEMIHRDDLVLL